MTIEYNIDENDFLTHQLYIASTSERIIKKRHRNRVIVPLVYFLLGFLLFLLKDQLGLLITFFIIAIVWYVVYPIWERRQYIRHYKGFIRENCKDRFGRTATLEFTNDFILAKDNGSESKVLTIELEEIIEIPTMFLLKLKGGQSFILPKDKISNTDILTTRLKELATHLSIRYKFDDNWKWK